MIPRSLAGHWIAASVSWQRLTARNLALASLVVLLTGALFKLATAGGGRDLEGLTLAQTIVFASAGVVLLINPPRLTRVVLAFAAIITSIALTSFWTVRPESSVLQLLLWLMYFGIVLVLVGGLRSLSAVRRFLDAVIVIGGWVCLVGLYLFWGANDPGMRWYSTFYAPNTFAAFLLLVLPLALSRLIYAVSRRHVFDFSFVSVLIFTSLILTSSRGAWLALGATVPLAVAILRPRSWPAAFRRLTVVAALTAACVAILTRVPWIVFDRTASLLEGGNRSIGDRLAYWTRALEAFRDHPVVGTGPGTFAYVHPQYQKSILVYAQDAHNLYVQTAVEMGVTGLLALTALIVSLAALWLHVLRRYRNENEHGLIAGIGLTLAAFFVHSGVEMNFAFPANPAMAFALVAVLASYAELAGPPSVGAMPRRSMPRWATGLAVVMGLAVLAVQVHQFAERRFLEGQRFLFVRQPAQAVERFYRAMRWNPLNPRYPSAAADAVYLLQQDDPRILKFVRRSIALDRTNPYYYLQLARALMDQPGSIAERQGEVEALIRRSLSLDPYHLPEAFQALVDLRMRTGDSLGAEGAYREALARFGGQGVAHDEVLRAMLWPRVVPLYVNWSNYLAARGRQGEAVSVLQSLLSEDPGIPYAYLRIADLHIRSRAHEAADLTLRDGLSHMPGDEMLWVRWRTLPSRRSVTYER